MKHFQLITFKEIVQNELLKGCLYFDWDGDENPDCNIDVCVVSDNANGCSFDTCWEDNFGDCTVDYCGTDNYGGCGTDHCGTDGTECGLDQEQDQCGYDFCINDSVCAIEGNECTQD
ncbi:MAG: hypothetical protein KDC67_04960 [Ignavibacteriae bacterium]|nr:hypothetical protein [Ignavibacteriota bacterium]